MRHYLTPWTSRERAEVPSLPFLAQEQVLSMIWTWERFGTHIVQPPIRAQGQQVVELPLQNLSSLKITTNEHSLLVGSSQHKPPIPENPENKKKPMSHLGALCGKAGLSWWAHAADVSHAAHSLKSPELLLLPACSAWGFARRAPGCCGRSFRRGPGAPRAPRSPPGCSRTRGARWTGSSE